MAVRSAAYERKTTKLYLDFDDLLRRCILLAENPDIRQRYRERYPHLLVDEFQIPTGADEVLSSFCSSSPESSLWVCDDWQSIYAFNGASLATSISRRSFRA